LSRARSRRRRRWDALFVDRDGTLIAERGYLSDPRGVRLARGAAAGLKAFTDEGTLLFVVTNQSGLARGVLTRAQVDAVNAEVVRRLAARGVPVAGVLVCPHYPGGVVPELSIRCRCRKPGTLLHARALAAHGLSGRRSAVLGDKWDDVGAGVAQCLHHVEMTLFRCQKQRALAVVVLGIDVGALVKQQPDYLGPPPGGRVVQRRGAAFRIAGFRGPRRSPSGGPRGPYGRLRRHCATAWRRFRP